MRLIFHGWSAELEAEASPRLQGLAGSLGKNGFGLYVCMSERETEGEGEERRVSKLTHDIKHHSMRSHFKKNLYPMRK